MPAPLVAFVFNEATAIAESKKPLFAAGNLSRFSATLPLFVVEDDNDVDDYDGVDGIPYLGDGKFTAVAVAALLLLPPLFNPTRPLVPPLR